jgi:hypothetical protein
MYVNEARSKHIACAIDYFVGSVVEPRPHRTDTIIRECNVGKQRLTAAAINHKRISDKGVAARHRNCLKDIRYVAPASKPEDTDRKDIATGYAGFSYLHRRSQ